MPEIVENVKEAVGNAWEATKEKGQQLKDSISGSTHEQKADNAWEASKDKARDAKNAAHEKAGELKEKMNH